jgi:UDP-N-acetylglucosamine 1-carboxyvinyltransferase
MSRMGADIQISEHKAFISGPTPLSGADLTCTDLRGGAALILNALIANGASKLKDIYYVERGYNRFQEKFAAMGACRMQRNESHP